MISSVARRLAAFAAVGLAMFGLTACDPSGPAITVDPGLYPVYQATVFDYVNRCDPAGTTDVDVTAPSGTTVSVAGQTAKSGTFTAQVIQTVNERFTITVNTGSTTRTHHVRCLPTDFPTWQAERTGTPQAQYYATVMIESFSPAYPVIFDTNGVPVWWTNREFTFFFDRLPNGNLATINPGGGMEERTLSGQVVRTLDTVGAHSDFHDVILKPNGNYVLATAEQRACDLSAWGEPPATCVFHTFQELTPAGAVVWSWAAEEDIPIDETTASWRQETEPLTGLRDPWHYNSVEWTGDGFIISFRHLDAVYKVDYDTKDIVWKLGGTPRAESLEVIGDPVFASGGTFSGQHDARLLSDGTVTLYDNGTKATPARAPRSVAYLVDEEAGRATLVEQLNDSVASGSGCCGSTRVLPLGNYVTGWGGTTWITENRQDGTRVFFLDANFVYRGIPIPYGKVSPAAFRDGMDAQF